MGLMDRERPWAGVEWRAHPNRRRAVSGTPKGWVAPGNGLKARTASVLLRTHRNPKVTSNLRNRCRARPKRILMHIDLDVNVRLWIAIGHLEHRLRIMASRSKIGKLRDGG